MKKWKDEDFLVAFLIVNGILKFSNDVKYPSIPCYIDKTSTIYLLESSCLLIGPEYLLAKRQGCIIDINSVFYIFTFLPKKIQWLRKRKKRGKERMKKYKPFHTIIKDIQRLRREHPKGIINNLLYKEMGNSIYANVVWGLSNKKSFDTLTGKTFRVTDS